ncbi:MAG: transposase [Magnetococcales bacterium]|nr:transposase [Magnetococcales bacterium]MBF0114705.1 transposase [Magnetococcales bacterium]
MNQELQSLPSDAALWATAAQLAGLPGLPQSERGVRLYAERAGLIKRKKKAGKGWEYHTGLLPAEAKKMLSEQEALPVEVTESAALPVVIPPRCDIRQTLDLKKWQRDIMDARLIVLREVERVAEEMTISEAIGVVVALAADGTLPSAVQAAVPVALAKKGGLSASTIRRWQAAEKLGLGALAPTAVERGEPEWVRPFMAVYRAPSRPTVADTLRQMGERGVAAHLIPSYAQALRHVNAIGEVEASKGRMTLNLLRTRLPFIRRYTGDLQPGDVVNGDGHLFYALVRHPNTGKRYQPEVTEIFDVATRRHIGWSIAFAESTLAVMDALRMAVEDLGVPRIVHYDNGSGVRNKNFQDEVTGLKTRLGFEFYHQTPGNPQAGGIVERGHQQILIPAARRFATYVGRRGKDDGLRRIVEKRLDEGKIHLPTIEEVVAVIDTLREQYNNRPHSSLPLMTDPVTGKRRHESPNEALQRHFNNGWRPVKVDTLEEFRLEEVRNVVRGEIRFHSMIYANAEGLRGLHGQVRVRYDPRDGSKIWVWSLDKDDRFICEALKDGNSAPYLIDSVQEHAEQKRLRGQLQRLDRKRLEKQAETRRTIEAEVVPLTIEQQEMADEMMDRLGMVDQPTAEVILLRGGATPSQPGSRPLFRGEFAERDWIVWALDHQEALSEEELDTLEAKLEDPRVRMMLGMDEEEESDHVAVR